MTAMMKLEDVQDDKLLSFINTSLIQLKKPLKLVDLMKSKRTLQLAIERLHSLQMSLPPAVAHQIMSTLIQNQSQHPELLGSYFVMMAHLIQLYPTSFKSFYPSLLSSSSDALFHACTKNNLDLIASVADFMMSLEMSSGNIKVTLYDQCLQMCRVVLYRILSCLDQGNVFPLDEFQMLDRFR